MLNELDLRELMDSGLTEVQAKATGHFSASKEQVKSAIGVNHAGLIFQYNDSQGKPYNIKGRKPFYRVKPRDWDADDPPKYLSPKGHGNRPYFSSLIKDLPSLARDTNIPTIITEGEKKADCLSGHGFFAIGLSGVFGWLDKSPRPGESDKDELEESRILPELKNEMIWTNRKVYIAFDSDIVSKPQVRKALQELAISLKDLGAFPFIVRIPNETNGDKNGVDDFIVRHSIVAFETLLEISTSALTAKNNLKLPRDPDKMDKVLLSWLVMKESWRYRPGIGYFTWVGTHWEPKTGEEFERELILFQDAQGWRDVSCLDTICRQLRARLLVGESLWNPDKIMIFRNGTLDCDTNTFISSHYREDFCTSLLDYEYDPTAKCPKFLSFLKDTVGENGESDLVRAFLKWILTPKPDKNAEIQKSLDIVGAKGSGKGTFLDVLISLVGRNNYTSINTETFNSQTNLATMLDKKVSIDFDAHGYLRQVGVFNSIVSNEPLQIRYLYKNPVSVRLKTVIVRAYNQYLDVATGSEGLNRRIVVLPFERRHNEIDLELGDKLKSEISGIFAWAWSLPLSTAKKIIMSAGSIKGILLATQDRFEANNPEFMFLSESFPDGCKRVKASDLYKSFSSWAKDSGLSPTKSRKFYESIQRLGCKKSPKSNGCFYYDVPGMSQFDLSEHLGLTSTIAKDEPEASRGGQPIESDYAIAKDEPEASRGGQPIESDYAIAKDEPMLQCGARVRPEKGYKPAKEDPVERAKELYDLIREGDQLRLNKHPFHKGVAKKIGVVLKKHNSLGCYVALVTIQGEELFCYLDGAEIVHPRKKQRCRSISLGVTGVCQSSLSFDGKVVVDWDECYLTPYNKKSLPVSVPHDDLIAIAE